MSYMSAVQFWSPMTAYLHIGLGLYGIKRDRLGF